MKRWKRDVNALADDIARDPGKYFADDAELRRATVHLNHGAAPNDAIARAKDWSPVVLGYGTLRCAECGTDYGMNAHRFHLRRRHGR